MRKITLASVGKVVTLRHVSPTVFRHALRVGIKAFGWYLLLFLRAGSADAHGIALPFTFWGNFMSDAADCQRQLGLAANTCALKAISIRNDCFFSLLNGGACDSQDTQNFFVQQAHIAAVDQIDQQCTTPEARALGFLVKFEAQTDLDNFCRAVDDAFVTEVYGPLTVGNGVHLPTATEQRCVGALALATLRILPSAFKTRRAALDLIAAHKMSPEAKTRVIDRSTVHIMQLQARLRDQMAETCTDAEFYAIYGRDVHSALSAMATRADCLAGSVYVQPAIVCPTPVCGNGMKEVGEECDDGNLAAADGCDQRCRLEVR
ncbi:MAG: hypothetical protein HY270_08430 [Deltaproteobacteria bacterium]|nr:hypothetical protein [Deltaproteobacteria bacterium]